jgi:hypothetical protein
MLGGMVREGEKQRWKLSNAYRALLPRQDLTLDYDCDVRDRLQYKTG